ncbi:MAG TPA: hypothetical protein VFX43_18250 [Chitinophagaceae bacterium]|nr:hypothetical protein [Chitinophagaceae bacterium]
MGKKSKEQEARIAAIFPRGMDDSRSTETLAHYKKYLEENLELPVEVTGIDDFSWEEFYLLGPGDKREYEQLRKSRPSYTDKFNLRKIAKDYNDFDGLFALVTRITDNKRFRIPLEELKVTDKKSKQYQLLNDYGVWFVNY